jgi:GNAT superfamily N-acetyltransferase
MIIRPAGPGDTAAIWSILRPIIRAGETYTLDRCMTEQDALAYWLGPDKESFVVEEAGVMLGTYYMRPNHAGGGGHVCNCGFMTDANAMGRGVARHMAEHALGHARRRGYRAMIWAEIFQSVAKASGDRISRSQCFRQWSRIGLDQASHGMVARRKKTDFATVGMRSCQDLPKIDDRCAAPPPLRHQARRRALGFCRSKRKATSIGSRATSIAHLKRNRLLTCSGQAPV